MDNTFTPKQSNNWIETYAKLGYLSKGLIYILIGALTGLSAIGMGGSRASNTDALLQVNSWAGGWLLLILLGIGLMGYALWRFIQAIKDIENKGNNLKGLAKRVAFIFSGAIYGALAIIAFKIAAGSQATASNGTREKMVATELLQKPFGKWIAIAVGIITIGNGLNQLIKAYKGSFMKKLDRLPSDKYRNLLNAGRAGYTARGIVFSIIGFLFVKAVWNNNPEKAEGTKGAFTFLQTSPYGSHLLAFVSLGLICYGIFMLVQAKYSSLKLG